MYINCASFKYSTRRRCEKCGRGPLALADTFEKAGGGLPYEYLCESCVPRCGCKISGSPCDSTLIVPGSDFCVECDAAVEAEMVAA